MLHTKLTDEERATLNAARAIIERHTPIKASWVISAGNYNGTFRASAAYFDSVAHGQHELWSPNCTFADKVQMAIDIEAKAAAEADDAKARRIALLKKQLASLEEEAA